MDGKLKKLKAEQDKLKAKLGKRPVLVGIFGVSGQKRHFPASEKAVECPSGDDRTFMGHRVRTAGRYVLQRNKRRRRGHKQQLGMTGMKSVFETGDVKYRLSQTRNEQKTSIAANKQGSRADRVSVGGLDKAIVGGPEPRVRVDSSPGRTTTRGVETAKPRPLPKAIAPQTPGPVIYTIPRPKYM